MGVGQHGCILCVKVGICMGSYHVSFKVTSSFLIGVHFLIFWNLEKKKKKGNNNNNRTCMLLHSFLRNETPFIPDSHASVHLKCKRISRESRRCFPRLNKKEIWEKNKNTKLTFIFCKNTIEIDIMSYDTALCYNTMRSIFLIAFISNLDNKMVNNCTFRCFLLG